MIDKVISYGIEFGGFVANWILSYPELSCCIMAGFLVVIAISAACKLSTR